MFAYPLREIRLADLMNNRGQETGPRASPVPEAGLVAVILPPGEGFGTGRAGAVALIVRRLAAILPALVIGGPQTGPVFDDAPFQSARPVLWWPAGHNTRYAVAVARLLRPLHPVLIEVHNRIDVALRLARWFPATPVSLFLHNDPQGMRHARSPRERESLLRSLAQVVTVSEFLRGRLLEGVAEGDWPAPVVLANAIDLSALPAQAERRENLILFAGRVVADKGPDVFVEACTDALPKLPGWRAVLIGADRSRPDSPDTPYVRSVRRAAEAAGVRLAGYRDHQEVLAAMSRAAIVVVPSRWQEPFGLAALEAMACGAALIAAPRGGLPEVAGNAALYVDPDDPASVAQAILCVARDPDLRMRLAEAGRARARRFGIQPAATRLAAIRRELLQRHAVG